MIDFSYTSQSGEIIEFYDTRGMVVKTYPLSELEEFVICQELNVSYRHDAVGGTGMVCDPNTDFEEVKVHELPSKWLDDQDNFLSATEKFYNSINKSEFKSNNIPKPI